mmetsp:Transcript_5082/g.7223  ORF Transcript_5082/g.7223 Transcript_5082/m.7223 type:complete len:228 (-) Transcript_5082:820-1503(-)
MVDVSVAHVVAWIHIRRRIHLRLGGKLVVVWVEVRVHGYRLKHFALVHLIGHSWRLESHVSHHWLHHHWPKHHILLWDVHMLWHWGAHLHVHVHCLPHHLHIVIVLSLSSIRIHNVLLLGKVFAVYCLANGTFFKVRSVGIAVRCKHKNLGIRIELKFHFLLQSFIVGALFLRRFLRFTLFIRFNDTLFNIFQSGRHFIGFCRSIVIAHRTFCELAIPSLFHQCFAV